MNDDRDCAPREEPDCFDCGDTGRRGRHSCASCNPTRHQALLGRLVSWIRTVVAWRPGRHDLDEPPF